MFGPGFPAFGEQEDLVVGNTKTLKILTHENAVLTFSAVTIHDDFLRGFRQRKQRVDVTIQLEVVGLYGTGDMPFLVVLVVASIYEQECPNL